MNIEIADTLEKVKKCFSIMVQLRTTLTEAEFSKRVKREQEVGYTLVYLQNNQDIVALAGFRLLESLVHGKFLYIDDLITDQGNRSKGFGDFLFSWLIAYAKQNDCQSLQLDSGVQRFEAHRFYIKQRMNIASHHFYLSLL